jgi:L-galactonate dehydratase
MHQLTRDMGKTWRYMVADSQYRWIGPEKSVTHLAVAGVLNAVWDLWGKITNRPVWKIVADMTPEDFVKCIDFRYITDAITPDEAVAMLHKTQLGKQERIQEALRNEAVPVTLSAANREVPCLLTCQGIHDICGMDGFYRTTDERHPSKDLG